VSPIYQGRGIARELLEEAHRVAINEKCVVSKLFVGSVWNGSISLYKKLGYKPYSISAHVPNIIVCIRNLERNNFNYEGKTDKQARFDLQYQ
jgi:ribosomal protein S18 acetylase RimI-like enzyme